MSIAEQPLSPLHNKLSDEFKLLMESRYSLQTRILDFCQEHVNLIPEGKRKKWAYGANAQPATEDLKSLRPSTYLIIDWEETVLRCLGEIEFCKAISGQSDNVKDGVLALMGLHPKYKSKLKQTVSWKYKSKLKQEIFNYLKYTYASHLKHYNQVTPNKQKMKMFHSGKLTCGGFTDSEVISLCDWLEEAYGVRL